MEPLETIAVETRTVGCDGGGGALGHPMVYLDLTKTGQADCPYCGRRYLLSRTARTGTHGH